MSRRLLLAAAASLALACAGTPKAGGDGDFWDAVPAGAPLYVRLPFGSLAEVEAQLASIWLDEAYKELRTDDVVRFGFGAFIFDQETWPGLDAGAPIVYAIGRFPDSAFFDAVEVGLLPEASTVPFGVHTRVVLAARNPNTLRAALDTYLTSRTETMSGPKPLHRARAGAAFVQLDLFMPFQEDASDASLKATMETLSGELPSLPIAQRPALEHFAAAPGELALHADVLGLRDIGTGMSLLDAYRPIPKDTGTADAFNRGQVSALSNVLIHDPLARELSDVTVSVDLLPEDRVLVDAVVSLTQQGSRVVSASQSPLNFPRMVEGDAEIELTWVANLPGMLAAAERPQWTEDGASGPVTFEEASQLVDRAGAMAYVAILSEPFALAKTALDASGGFLPMGLQLPLGFQVRVWSTGETPEAAATVVFPTGTNVGGLLTLISQFGGDANGGGLRADSVTTPDGVALRVATGRTLDKAFVEGQLSAPIDPGLQQVGRRAPEALSPALPVDPEMLGAAVGARTLSFETNHLRFRSISGEGPLPPAPPLRATGFAPVARVPVAACAYRAQAAAAELFQTFHAEAEADARETARTRYAERFAQIKACTREHSELKEVREPPEPPVEQAR